MTVLSKNYLLCSCEICRTLRYPYAVGYNHSMVTSVIEEEITRRIMAQGVCRHDSLNESRTIFVTSLLGLAHNHDVISFGQTGQFWKNMDALNMRHFKNQMTNDFHKLFYNGGKIMVEIVWKNYLRHRTTLSKEKRAFIISLFNKDKNKIRAQGLFDMTIQCPQIDNLSSVLERFSISHEHKVILNDIIGDTAIGSQWVNFLTSVGLFLAQLYQSPSLMDLSLATMQFLIASGISKYITVPINNIVSLVHEQLRRVSGTVVAQGAQDEEILENFYVAIYKVFCSMFGIGDTNLTRMSSNRARKVFEMWRAVKTIEDIGNTLIKYLKMCRDWAIHNIFGFDLGKLDLCSFYPKVKAWYERVVHLYAEEGNFKATISLPLAQEIKQLYIDGLEHFKALKLLNCPNNEFMVFHNALGMIKELFLHAQALNCTTKTRVPPLVIHFYGGAGLGKSTLCNFVVGDLAKNAGFKEFSNDLIYVRDVQQEFWDGYTGQFATIYDDIFQSDDSTKRGLEAIELIRANNTMQMPLHMADLQQKGTMSFSSKVVIMTSNPSKERGIGISTDDAFWRRRDLVVKVLPNTKYCDIYKNGMETKWRVNTEKVYDATGEYYHHDIYRFDVEHPETGSILFADIDYNELSRMIISKYNSKNVSTHLLIDAIERRFYAQGEIGVNALVRFNPFMFPRKEESDVFLSCIEARTFATTRQPTFLKYLKTIMDVYLRNKWWIDVSGIVLGFAATLLILWYSNRGSSKPVAEVGVSGDERTKKVVVRTRMRAEVGVSGDDRTTKRVERTRMRDKINAELLSDKLSLPNAEGSRDPNALQLIYNKLYKNTALVTARSGREFITMRCIFIKGRAVVVPAHLLQIGGELIMDFSTSYGVYDNINLQDCECYDDADLDLALLVLPGNVTEFPDISMHFISEHDVCYGDISSGMLYKHDGHLAATGMLQCLQDMSKISKIDYFLDVNGSSIPCHTIKCVRYQTHTMAGMCGSPIVVSNPKISRKILGFHVAGSREEGYATIVTSEYINKVLSMVTLQLAPIEPEIKQLDSTPEILVGAEGRIGFIGVVDKGKGVFSMNKTDIIKSPIFEEIYSSKTLPSLLKRTKILDPMSKGIAKYFDKSVYIAGDLEYLRKDLVSEYKVLPILDKEKQILTIDEAINGCDTYEFLTPMNLDTSVGYPYINMSLPIGKAKRKLLVLDNGRWQLGDIIKQRYDYRLEQARKGFAIPTIWVDNLKDERRTIQKVIDGKTRVFVTGPCDYTILFRQFFLGFTSFIMNNRLEQECAVGINPHSFEWNRLWNRVNSISNGNWIAGDFGAYDGRLPTQVMRVVCDVVNDWYDDGAENRLIRQVLFMSLYGSYHIVDNIVYRVNHGNPSGNPFTAVMNSIANTILMRYAFMDIGKDRYWDMSHYRKWVRATNYGDDNLLCVHEIADDYNMINISKSLENVGVVYTSTDKDGLLRKWTDREKVVFLKRAFVYNKRVNAMLAPLNFDSVTEMLNWIRSGQPVRDAMMANVRSSLLEMFHYGEARFNCFKEELDRCLIKHKLRPESSRWTTYLNVWYGEKYINECIL